MFLSLKGKNDYSVYLNNVKDDLSIGRNYYENVSREEFEKTLAKRRTFKWR